MGRKIEMGSEYWSMPTCSTRIDCTEDRTRFVLSGRTALQLAAEDLIKERQISSICLPAYCCDSMVFPLQKAGLKLRFYNVLPFSGGIQRVLPEKHGCDAVLLLDYFGYTQKETVALAKREHDRGTAVILDRVQSLYSPSDTICYADYSITSWRKWFFSCTGAAKKHHGKWVVGPYRKANEQYVFLRNQAAEKKAAYMDRGTGNKETFLNAFAEAEKVLDADFSDYAADRESRDALRNLDVSFLKQRRRENAALIYEALLTMGDQRIRPLFPQLGPEDTPLFVPVMVEPEVRADLRCFLIRNQVYCPVHWPRVQTGGGEALYDAELSLLCDQRYTTEDIQWEMYLIKEFFAHHA